MYNSDAKQDNFVDIILRQKNNGIYLDIGSCDSQMSNNTFFFSQNRGWRGICIEIEEKYNETYKNRNFCTYLNCDATKIDYKTLLMQYDSLNIDYISIDIDAKSLDVLKIIPWDLCKTRVITIEHDYYLYGDKYRNQQRYILDNAGYILIFGDVHVEQNNYPQNLPFEDWYVADEVLTAEQMQKIISDDICPSDAIKLLSSVIMQ